MLYGITLRAQKCTVQFKHLLHDNIFELPLFSALYINTAFFLILDYPQFETHILGLYLRTACKHPYNPVHSCGAI